MANCNLSTKQISYLLAEGLTNSSQNNCNYLLVNDGTGKLYTALHDEFMAWGSNVKNYLDSLGIAYNSAFIAPKFIAYETASGSINYLAQWVGANDAIPLVNVPVQYNLTTDFTQDVTVSDRNQSTLIRTWAGHDSFYDKNANTSAHIDGGLGIDVAYYSGKVTQYKVLNNDKEFQVSLSGQSSDVLKDTLVNIERLHFTDTSLALDIGKGQNAGEIYRLYEAAFDRAPKPVGEGYWLNKLDNGETLVEIANEFTATAEFQRVYGGSAPDYTFYVTELFQHVLGRAPKQTGLDYWSAKLVNGESYGAVLAGISESDENDANVATLITNGIQYQEVA